MTSLRLELAHAPASASQARAAVRELLASWHDDPEAVDDAVLVTSELVGNAVRHGRPPVVLEARASRGEEGRTLELVCADGGSWLLPIPGEGGRGLPMVELLCRDVEVESNGGGTVVRALLVR